MYEYPNTIVEKLRERWPQVRYAEDAVDDVVPELPVDEVLETLLGTCYQASVEKEEGRALAFRVALLKRPERPLEEVDSPSTARRAPVPLRDRRRFSVQELVRLAPATDPRQVMICVQEDRDGLWIWGLLDSSSSWWRWLSRRGEGGYPPPNALTISSRAPGSISVSRMGLSVLSLVKGELQYPRPQTLRDPEIEPFFREAQKGLTSDVRETTEEDLFGEDGEVDEYVAGCYQRVWERLLLSIQGRGHGATIIVVPDEMDVSDTRLADAVELKYRADYSGTWQVLTESIAARSDYWAKYLPRRISGARDGEPPVGPLKELDDAWEARRNADNALDDACNLLVGMSQVDGALVLSDRFRVLGFGGEIVATSRTLTQVIVKDEEPDGESQARSIDAYGTRHRSAFRFCSSCEWSMAFILSQDGGCKAVRRIGPQLGMWPDVSMGPSAL